MCRRAEAIKKQGVGKVTRENKPAAQSIVYSAASLVIGAIMVSGLCGCETIFSQNAGLTDASLAQRKATVAISPVQGVPEKYAAKINEQLTASMKEKGVQLADAKDADYVIKTSYTAAPEAKAGTKLTYAFQIIDKTGKEVRKLEGGEIVSKKHGGDSWNHVTDDAMQQVASKSAGDLAGWAQNPNAPVAVAAAVTPAAPATPAASEKPKAHPVNVAAKHSEPAATLSADVATTPKATPKAKPASAATEVAVVVPEVTGAPGDGKTALAEAMKRALAKEGVKLASTAAGAYKVQGTVEVGQAANGQQPVTIKWIVLDPSGKQLKDAVVQRNNVAEGQFNQSWGDVADAVAGNAAKPVANLLSKPAAAPGKQAQAGTPG
jgi:hypothetical protein